MRTALVAIAIVAGAAGAAGTAPAPREAPAARLPIVKERLYVMSGAVRPLLFWMGRDDIGLARIVWRRGADGARGYDLLVGTEPAKAPRGINRWGFISEESLGADGSLLALMTGSHETTYDDENRAAATPGGGDFRAIVARVESGTAHWQLSRVRTPQALTVHDLDAAVGSVSRSPDAVHRERRVAASTRPGFLLAVAELLDQALASAADPRQTVALQSQRIQYVFGEQMYELRVRSTNAGALAYAGGRAPVLKTAFETRTLSTGNKSQFIVTVGTQGELSGVPLHIEWQPRWWLKVRLALKGT